MGSVWVAVDERLGRRVAVKVLHEHLAEDPSFVERFRREARHAAAIEHPNVVRVLDSGVDADRPFIVMELVEGESLRDALGRTGTLDAPATIAIGRAVLDGLEATHRAGIVHRDVKPGNVLLGRDGSVKLADLGIAKTPGEHTLTRTGEVLGTPQYLAPEVLAGAPATVRSDVYAVGCLLYECLTGSPPDPGHRDRVPPPPIPRDVPSALARAIAEALERDPARRPGGAREMREILDAAGPASTATVPFPRAGDTVPMRRDGTMTVPAGGRAPQRRRRSPSTIVAWIVATVAVAAAVAIGALAARNILEAHGPADSASSPPGRTTTTPTETDEPTSSPSTSVSPSMTVEQVALSRGSLSPGSYRTTTFEPTVAFSVEPGWRGDGEARSVFVLGDVATRGSLAFARVDRVFDANGTPQPPPDDLVGWLAQQDGIRVNTPRDVTVGGVHGSSVDVLVGDERACADRCSRLFAAGPATLRVGAGRILRVIVLDNGVTIAMDAEASTFDAFASRAGDVLTSARFEG